MPKYGRFDHMTREQLEAHLESRGFACYERETTDALREAAYLDEKSEQENIDGE